MSSSNSKSSSFTRKGALLSIAAGIIFLLVAISNPDRGWRIELSFIAGVLRLVLGVVQFRRAKND